MSKKSNLKPIAVALGAIFAILLVVSPVVNAADNPFGMTELSKDGYMIAAGMAKTYYKQGNAKSLEGDYETAIASFDLAIELKPDFADAYHSRGRAKFELGDYHGAIADYERAIALDPDGYVQLP